jgi:hypothetical protein
MLLRISLICAFHIFFSLPNVDRRTPFGSEKKKLNAHISETRSKDDPHAAYRADRDFLLLDVTARIICAAFHVLGMNNTKDKPQQLQTPETIKDQSKMEKRQFLHKAAAKIVDEIIVNEQMMDATIST